MNTTYLVIFLAHLHGDMSVRSAEVYAYHDAGQCRADVPTMVHKAQARYMRTQLQDAGCVNERTVRMALSEQGCALRHGSDHTYLCDVVYLAANNQALPQ